MTMKPGELKALDKAQAINRLTDEIERIEASVRANVVHPLRVIKRQFDHLKVRSRGLATNTAQLKTSFALSNLWMAHRKLWVSMEKFAPMRRLQPETMLLEPLGDENRTMPIRTTPKSGEIALSIDLGYSFQAARRQRSVRCRTALIVAGGTRQPCLACAAAHNG